jgi:hypothetical protein
MGERKVINKYFPSDFDPNHMVRRGGGSRKCGVKGQTKVRMMLPMSIRCLTCGEYMYQGKKFNSRKETVSDDDYLGLEMFRFYIKCPRCSSECTIRTDPKNSNYKAELNCSRNFEAWSKTDEEVQDVDEEEYDEEDTMKQLEDKTIDSKIEMDMIDDLDEIKSIQEQNSTVTVEDLLDKHRKTVIKEDKERDIQDEDVIQLFKMKNLEKKEKEKIDDVNKNEKTEINEDKKRKIEEINPINLEVEVSVKNPNKKKKKKNGKEEISGLFDY